MLDCCLCLPNPYQALLSPTTVLPPSCHPPCLSYCLLPAKSGQRFELFHFLPDIDTIHIISLISSESALRDGEVVGSNPY